MSDFMKHITPGPYHWDSAEGLAMALEYSALRRDQIGHSHLTDFALANAIYLVGRDDLRLIGFQTSAKERIRWLSVQLLMARNESAELLAALSEFVGAVDAGTTFADVSVVDLARAAIAKAKGGEA